MSTNIVPVESSVNAGPAGGGVNITCDESVAPVSLDEAIAVLSKNPALISAWVKVGPRLSPPWVGAVVMV